MLTRDEASSPRELFLALSRSAPGTLRSKLAEACREAIRDDLLRAGERLPSTRALAEQLGVSRGVVSDAYQELATGGYIELQDRASPRVSGAGRPGRQPATVRPDPRPARYSFALLAGDLSLFPRTDWLRCTQAVLRSVSDAELDYLDPVGHTALRGELADYLRRVRGVHADLDRILITQGNTQALEILFGVLAAGGARRVALENPSFESPWQAARRAGLEPVALEVDEEGARPDRLRELAPDAVFLTPAHQFPLGPVLAAHRRAAFVEWAVNTGGYVIEDDYDAEFRYDRDPVMALHRLAPDHVIYVGTASKMLAPALRLGWLVLPRELLVPCREAKLHSDGGSPTIDQLVFAEILRRGLLDRHLRRVRDAYRARRDLLLEGLRLRLPHATVYGYAAGVHVTVLLPGVVDETVLRREADRRSIVLRTLDEFAFAPHGHGSGVLVGYTKLSVAALDRALDALAESVKAAESDLGGPGEARASADLDRQRAIIRPLG